MRTHAAAALLLLVLVSPAAAPLRAVDLDHVLADYALTSWTTKDGLTGPVWGIAQGSDDYLWLGTDEGLLRFDGVRFVPWPAIGRLPLPAAPVRALYGSRDGSLWVGYSQAVGISRVRDGLVTTYGEAEGVPPSSVTALVEDRAGTLWAATSAGLLRLDGERWELLDERRGVPPGPVFSLFVDEEGTLLAGAAAAILRKIEGADRFDRLDGSPEAVRGLAADADGALWSTDPLIGFRAIGGQAGFNPPPGRGFRLLHDRRGNLWVGTLGQGLWRARPADRRRRTIDRARVLTGLSSDGVRSLLEDREGNVWAGTSEGLTRLTPHRVTPILTLGLVTAIDAGRDGRVWVATAEELIRFSETDGGWQSDPARLALPGIRALQAEPDGSVLVAAGDDLLRIADGRVARVPLPGALPLRVDAILTDHRGGSWLVDRDHGVWQWRGDRLAPLAEEAGVPDGRILTAYADRTGRLWLATIAGELLVVEEGRARRFEAGDGLGAGPYNVIYEDGNGVIWVGGAGSLSWYADERFASVGVDRGLPAAPVLSIIEDDERQLWAGTSAGLLRIARDEIMTAAGDTSRRVRTRRYDVADGIGGLPVRLGNRSAVRTADSRLWIGTSGGLTIVDPRTLGELTVPSPVRIESVLADERRVSPAGEAVFAPGTKRVQIDYTAPRLTSPFRTRFRYRLEGFDAGWIDAGTRRQAVYTNLPPRDYRFRVAASDAGGVWEETEAVWAFSLRPFFYQTAWFWIAGALALGALVWGAWHYRERQMRRQFALVLGERVRLSHELHDTLLQSLVGVALQFGAVSNSLDSSPATAREHLGRARRQIEQYIREARRSIWNLRSAVLEERDLVAALRESGERAVEGAPVGFRVDVTGSPRRLPSAVEHELLRIGQEAVLNAVRHARAATIDVQLRYADEEIALRVRDDGIGFDPARSPAGAGSPDDRRPFAIAGATGRDHPGAHTPGAHYGLTTMRERAERVGGRLRVDSAPGAGTTVEAIVPLDSGARGAQAV